MTTQPIPNFYDVLGVPRNATTEQIRDAYRKLVREHHPDSFSDARKAAEEAGNEKLLRILEEKIREAEEELKLINEAYETLSDPIKRLRYDEELDQQAQQGARGTSSAYTTPPDIRLSKTAIDFGQVTRGERRSDSFIIYNDGGPVSDVTIGWVEDLPWVEARVNKDPINTFPIQVTVLVDSTRASVGRNAAGIAILINGVPWGIVPVLVTVLEPAPQPIPTYTITRQPVISRPAPVATKKSSRSLGGLIIVFGAILGLMLVVLFLGTSRGSKPNVPPTQQQAVEQPSKTSSRPPFPFLLSVSSGSGIEEVIDGLGNVRKTINLEDLEEEIFHYIEVKIIWSPDGSKIAYPCNFGIQSNWNYGRSICIAKADGTNSRRLVTVGIDQQGDETVIDDPAWSPNGTQIAFSWISGEGTFGETSTIGIVNINTQKLNRIAFEDIPYTLRDGYYAPTWSPRGDQLAVVHEDPNAGYSIYVVNLNGILYQKVSTGGNDVSPDWSPDGRRLAYNDRQGNVCIVNADGSNQKCHELGGAANSPVWSPDGKWIATSECYVEHSGSWYSGTCVVPVYDNNTIGAPLIISAGTNPSWIPNSG